jgi:hypothetical protein
MPHRVGSESFFDGDDCNDVVDLSPSEPTRVERPSVVEARRGRKPPTRRPTDPRAVHGAARTIVLRLMRESKSDKFDGSRAFDELAKDVIPAAAQDDWSAFDRWAEKYRVMSADGWLIPWITFLSLDWLFTMTSGDPRPGHRNERVPRQGATWEPDWTLPVAPDEVSHSPSTRPALEQKCRDFVRHYFLLEPIARIARDDPRRERSTVRDGIHEIADVLQFTQFPSPARPGRPRKKDRGF